MSEALEGKAKPPLQHIHQEHGCHCDGACVDCACRREKEKEAAGRDV